MSFILTYSGKAVDVLNLRMEDIYIVDIAKSLSQQCRFTGHTRVFYSVAEHCLRMSRVVPPGLALRALLHDASEAYLTNVPPQIKPLLKGYGKIEGRVRAQIYKRFGLAQKSPDDVIIHHWGRVMRATERRDLMPPGGPEWDSLRGVEPLEYSISPWPADGAEDLFINRFADLYEQHKERLRAAKDPLEEMPELRQGERAAYGTVNAREGGE